VAKLPRKLIFLFIVNGDQKPTLIDAVLSRIVVVLLDHVHLVAVLLVAEPRFWTLSRVAYKALNASTALQGLHGAHLVP